MLFVNNFLQIWGCQPKDQVPRANFAPKEKRKKYTESRSGPWLPGNRFVAPLKNPRLDCFGDVFA